MKINSIAAIVLMSLITRVMVRPSESSANPSDQDVFEENALQAPLPAYPFQNVHPAVSVRMARLAKVAISDQQHRADELKFCRFFSDPKVMALASDGTLKARDLVDCQSPRSHLVVFEALGYLTRTAESSYGLTALGLELMRHYLPKSDTPTPKDGQLPTGLQAVTVDREHIGRLRSLLRFQIYAHMPFVARFTEIDEDRLRRFANSALQRLKTDELARLSDGIEKIGAMARLEIIWPMLSLSDVQPILAIKTKRELSQVMALFFPGKLLKLSTLRAEEAVRSSILKIMEAEAPQAVRRLVQRLLQGQGLGPHFRFHDVKSKLALAQQLIRDGLEKPCFRRLILSA